MILWTIVWLLIAAPLIWYRLVVLRNYEKRRAASDAEREKRRAAEREAIEKGLLPKGWVTLDSGGWISRPDVDGYAVATVGASLFFGLCSLIFSASAWHNNVSAASDAVVIAQRMEQRDELVELISDELAADQLVELLHATPDDIPNLHVWLGNNAGDVLSDRAGRILAINGEVFDRQLDVTNKRKEACDIRNNPFVPRFPFGLGMPDCELDLP